MGKRLTPEQLALYKRVDEILFYKWDPIGVSDSDWVRDEYQSYVPRVFSLLIHGETQERVASYLTEVSFERMGLEPYPEHDLEIANLLLLVKDRCLN